VASRARRIVRALPTIGAIAFALLAYVYLTLPDVRALATTNPQTTAFMEMRAREARAQGKKPRRAHTWVRYSRISPHLKRAVLVAEDGAFWNHEGIDYAELRKALEDAMGGSDFRGASTLTQQLAKNLYLSPSRDPLRKLRELIITRRLEANLKKARIFEIYLNVVEWGDGIWGAEAAARAYFGVPASALNREQSALLAGALINPIRYSPARPPARLRRRQQIILARMGGVEAPPALPVEVPPETVLPGTPEETPEETLSPPDDEPLREPNVPSAPEQMPEPVQPSEPPEPNPANPLPSVP
jgi:monofunctional biosynthetic peptidoglycan transglycosylase